MKKSKVFLIAGALFITVVLLFGGCGGLTGGTTWSTIISFVEKAAEALPDFESTVSANLASRNVSRAVWNLGSPVYEIYGILNNNGDTAGYFNLYDLLDTADERFSDLYDSGTEISLQSIESPIALGFNNGTDNQYDFVYNYDGADNNDPTYYSRTFGRKDGNAYYMLNSVRMDRTDGEKSRSIIQAVYDDDTGEIRIGMFMANYVGESGGTDWEKVKVYAEGNTETGVFSLKVIRDGYAYDHNILGYGDSSGDSDYFLLKVDNESVDMVDGVYYTFDAGATVTELKDMDDAGEASPSTDTENYEAEIADMTAFTEADDIITDTAAEALLETPVSYTE